MGNEILQLNDNTTTIAEDLVSEKAQKSYEKFAIDLKNKTKTKDTKEVTDAFTDHADDVLEWIKNNMINNFATIDETNKKIPMLSTYEDAKTTFDTDIKSLIVLNPLEAKKTKKTKNNRSALDDVYASTKEITKDQISNKAEKLNKSLKITTDIGYIIQLKKLEAGIASTDTFEAEKLKDFVRDNNFEKKMAPKSGKWETLITTEYTSKKAKDAETIKTAEEKTDLGVLLDSPPSLPIAKQLFETNKDAWDALIKGDTDKEEHLKSLLRYYAGDDKQDVESYKIKNYKDKETSNKASRDSKYTYIQVTYKTVPAVAAVPADPTTNTKAVAAVPEIPAKSEDIMRGASTDVLHQARADAYKWTIEWTRDIASATITDNLKKLDEKWSYRQFKNNLEKGWTTFLSWLLGAWLLKDINTYRPVNDSDNKINRYYGVILDYIVENKDESLLKIYLNNIVVGGTVNIKYLWTDRANQVANYNKIAEDTKWQKNSTDRLTLEKIKLQLVPSIDTKSLAEAAKSWVDSFFKTYGNVIIDILEFFGGKWAARSFLKGLGVSDDTLDKYFTELDKKYKERFWLSDEQRTILNEDFYKAYNDTTSKKETDKMYIGDDKTAIPYDKSTIITLATKTFKWTDFQYLDPVLVAKAAKALDIADATSKEKKDGKIIKTVNNETSDTDKERIVKYLLTWKDSAEPTWTTALWKEITKTANTIMNTDRVYSDIALTGKTGDALTSANTRNDQQKTKKSEKWIKKWCDIALFVWAYMMKWSDNLTYTITETDDLKNETTEAPEEPKGTAYTVNAATTMKSATALTTPISLTEGDKVTAVTKEGKDLTPQTWETLWLTDAADKTKIFTEVETEDKVKWWVESTYLTAVPTTPEVTKEKLAFIGWETLVDKTGIVTTLGWSKKIHEVIDATITTAPKKINITTATGKTTEATLVTLADETKTYVATTNATKTGLTIADRIQFVAWDKITLVEAVPETTVADTRTAIDKKLKEIATTIAQGFFEKTPALTGTSTDAYTAEIQKISNLFTGTDYDNLIAEPSQTTVKTLVKDNMDHFKNMFTFWNLQIAAKNTTYTNGISSTITDDQLKYIDTKTQDFAVTKAEGKTITISVTKKNGDIGKDAKEWTITISKHTTDKLTTTRVETTSAPVK